MTFQKANKLTLTGAALASILLTSCGQAPVEDVSEIKSQCGRTEDFQM